jgi:hypothetical protein
MVTEPQGRVGLKNGCNLQNSIQSAMSQALPAFLPSTKRFSSCSHRDLIVLSTKPSIASMLFIEYSFCIGLMYLLWKELLRVPKTF